MLHRAPYIEDRIIRPVVLLVERNHGYVLPVGGVVDPTVGGIE